MKRKKRTYTVWVCPKCERQLGGDKHACADNHAQADAVPLAVRPGLATNRPLTEDQRRRLGEIASTLEYQGQDGVEFLRNLAARGRARRGAGVSAESHQGIVADPRYEWRIVEEPLHFPLGISVVAPDASGAAIGFGVQAGFPEFAQEMVEALLAWLGANQREANRGD